jgi:RNA polymerase sigma-70 factor (ECF subfamily)
LTVFPAAEPPIPADQIARWIQAARAGDGKALGCILEACRPYLLSLARQRVRGELQPRVGSSDVVQDTFIDAQRAFARFHGSTEGELRAWLRCILLGNVAQSYADHYRQKRAVSLEVELAELAGWPKAGPPDRGESPSSEASANERDRALQEALDRLPESYRQVIMLRNYECHTFEEAGERLGRSEGAIRKLWVRAIDRLRELLEKCDDSRS